MRDMREKVKDDSMDFDLYDWESKIDICLVREDCKKNKFGKLSEVHIWTGLRCTLDMQVLITDFTRLHWRGDWTGENDRDDDTLYLRDEGPGSLCGDSNARGIWETVSWFLLDILACNSVSQLLWLRRFFYETNYWFSSNYNSEREPSIWQLKGQDSTLFVWKIT